MINEAIKLARKNNTDLARLGAILVKDGVIIGKGKNTRRSHPLQFRFSKSSVKISLHAEIAAIADALRKYDEEDLKGSTIYVARILKSGSTGKAKPCSVCQEALKHFGIEAVFWTEYEE